MVGDYVELKYHYLLLVLFSLHRWVTVLKMALEMCQQPRPPCVTVRDQLRMQSCS